MELAIKKAKEVGVAWVTCTGKSMVVVSIEMSQNNNIFFRV